MIAKNYRKFPEAMALQLVLVFGACVWHTSRPTTRAGRAIRAARGQLVKHTPQLVNWVKVATPQWWKDANKAAKHLADQVKNSLARFVWDQPETPTMDTPKNTDPISNLKDEAKEMRRQFGMPGPFTFILKFNKFARWDRYGCESRAWGVQNANSYRD